MSDVPVIIGMACRVPGATTPSKLWENILSMKDLQRPMPKDRFNVDAFHHPDNTHKGTVSYPFPATYKGCLLTQDHRSTPSMDTSSTSPSATLTPSSSVCRARKPRPWTLSSASSLR